jgi:hypothetical protein
MTVLQRKDTTNISELNDFFISSEKVCDTVLWIISAPPRLSAAVTRGL